MRFTFDPAKAASNLAKHGVGFEMVEQADWDVALVMGTFGHETAEPRLMAYVPVAGRLHVLVYSIETASMRVISLRKANNREKRDYAEA